MIKRIRLELLLVIAQLLLPRGVLDNRGVMQGRSIQDLIREEI